MDLKIKVEPSLANKGRYQHSGVVVGMLYFGTETSRVREMGLEK